VSGEFGIPELGVAPEDLVCAHGARTRRAPIRAGDGRGGGSSASRRPRRAHAGGREVDRSSGRYPRRLAFTNDLTRGDGGIVAELPKMHPTPPFVSMVIDHPHDLGPDEVHAMQG
jgi:hypothetical protein